jgi:hypothetical protein
MTGEGTWALVRDEMETARLDFINTARHGVLGVKEGVADVPFARRPLSEIREMCRHRSTARNFAADRKEIANRARLTPGRRGNRSRPVGASGGACAHRADQGRHC